MLTASNGSGQAVPTNVAVKQSSQIAQAAPGATPAPSIPNSLGLGPIYYPPKPAAPTPYAAPAPTAAPTQTPAPAPSYGTQSGPGILESWFNQRANGTDPGYEYALSRGLTSIGNQYSAAGEYNSGAARQGQSDFQANMAAQREGQLDALAGGASAEHQGSLNSMFNEAAGLAGGQAGLAGPYDIGASNAMSQAQLAVLQMYLNKAGVDQQTKQSIISGLESLGGSALGVLGGRGK